MRHTLRTGLPTVDHYLETGFGKVPGFSSRFSATICGHLLRRQSELGIRGSVAEIGTFEGRFFIMMGLALAKGEHAYGFDLFDWPGSQVLDRLLANADKYCLLRERFTPVALDTSKLGAGEFSRHTGGAPLRFVHIDG